MWQTAHCGIPFGRFRLHAHGADCSVPSTQVQEGDTVGELSLVANRPLWYSLVVASATARVATIALTSLKEYVSTQLPPDAQER